MIDMERNQSRISNGMGRFLVEGSGITVETHSLKVVHLQM